MLCKFCENELEDGASFCPKCGKRVSSDTEEIKANINEFAVSNNGATEINDPKRTSKEGGVLCFSILGLAFALSFYLSPIALIFSIISRIKLRKYVKDYGQARNRAAVGKGIGLAWSDTNDLENEEGNRMAKDIVEVVTHAGSKIIGK